LLAALAKDPPLQGEADESRKLRSIDMAGSASLKAPEAGPLWTAALLNFRRRPEPTFQLDPPGAINPAGPTRDGARIGQLSTNKPIPAIRNDRQV
jgi:hypothetical protein